MDNQVDIDIEQVAQTINNNTFEMKPFAYSNEWLTVECIESVESEIKNSLDSFNSNIESMKKYINRLKDISETTAPDVDDVEWYGW